MVGDEVELSHVDAFTRADLLKVFLRELPEPAFPYSFFQQCIDAESNSPSQPHLHFYHMLVSPGCSSLYDMLIGLLSLSLFMPRLMANPYISLSLSCRHKSDINQMKISMRGWPLYAKSLARCPRRTSHCWMSCVRS